MLDKCVGIFAEELLKMHKTTVCYRTCDPKYNQSFIFDIIPGQQITFEAFSSDEVGRDEPLGSVQHSLSYFYPRRQLIPICNQDSESLFGVLWKYVVFKFILILSNIFPQGFRELWLLQTQITTGFMVQKAS